MRGGTAVFGGEWRWSSTSNRQCSTHSAPSPPPFLNNPPPAPSSISYRYIRSLLNAPTRRLCPHSLSVPPLSRSLSLFLVLRSHSLSHSLSPHRCPPPPWRRLSIWTVAPLFEAPFHSESRSRCPLWLQSVDSLNGRKLIICNIARAAKQ